MEFDREFRKKYFNIVKNRISKTDYRDNFHIFWGYNTYFSFNQQLPPFLPKIFEDSKSREEVWRVIGPWDIDTYIRLTLTYSNNNYPYKTLKEYQRFPRLINDNKALENAISERTFPVSNDKILSYLSLLSFSQFPLQNVVGHYLNIVSRYAYLYKPDEISSIIRSKYNLAPEQIYIIGLAVVGWYIKHFTIKKDITSELPGISNDDLKVFFSKFSTTFNKLKLKFKEYPELDEEYQFHFNWLRYYPLVEDSHCYYCPSPILLLDRILSGLHYDFDKNGDVLGDLIGKRVEEYISFILDKSKVVFVGEKEYTNPKKKSEKKKTIDFTLEDRDSIVFLEVKHRNLVSLDVRSKYTGYKKLIEEISAILCKSYKTLEDYKMGLYPHMKYSPSKKTFLLLLTLGDIYVFPYNFTAELKIRLIEKGINKDLIEEIPFFFVSPDSFEYLLQIIAKEGFLKAFNEYISKESLPLLHTKLNVKFQFREPWDVFNSGIRPITAIKTLFSQ
ncbi:hypothetical protein M0R04_01340 [Candidatus Dojkabacteria bacterium]|jgi:hypothetical protein|nr:hypothetical protein [Candidatus Dojkabacteria bacterium]